MNLYSYMQTGEDIPKPFNTCHARPPHAKRTNFEDILFLLLIFRMLKLNP